jgi:Alr-MurF fusion protein
LKYHISHIAKVLKAEAVLRSDDVTAHLLVDSRKLTNPASSLFFALISQRRNGHQFIPELYNKGVRNFVVSEKGNFEKYPGANFLLVKDTLDALQQLAAYHRTRFTKPPDENPLPVIGITGSNGKTIVKEWLYQLLHPDYNIVRSPKSYNSQIGVPLSVWQMNEQHTLAIFEAGISQPGEMDKLEKIIQPTIAVLTNIGEAHSEGFSSREEKEKEKMVLFRNAIRRFPLSILAIEKKETATVISAFINHHDPVPISIEIPFTDDASVQNAIRCWEVMLWLEIPMPVVQERMKLLQPVNMRLELKKGINHCLLINDSYSADTSSLEIALNFLAQQGANEKRTAILSDFLQTSVPDDELYRQVASSLAAHHVKRVICIGHRITAAFEKKDNTVPLPFSLEFFPDTDDFLKRFLSSKFKEETILIKGARIFSFEKIVQQLELKAHQTVLEINLDAVAHNLKEYQRIVKPGTKVMAMVKAFAYGSGGVEIAGILQYHKADYLGVAYADEGVELRKAGIDLPIMVMNPEENAFEAITEYNLEPELYSFDILHAFEQYIQSQGLQQYPVHIEIETGMNRLGFPEKDAEILAHKLAASPSLKVQSVFSHLAASEDPAQDLFTQQQATAFGEAVTSLKKVLPYTFLSHIANSAAAVRHPHLQMDMVRLGIGLYGVDSAATGKLNLQTVAALRSTIAQIKKLKAGETVSYNRKGMVERDSLIATIRLGYADGYPRRLGNGVGKVWVGGQLVPVVGAVCMDMLMVDITATTDVKEGDDVVIFGNELPVTELAAWAGTIPYEIMTGISQRVKRVYFEE